MEESSNHTFVILAYNSSSYIEPCIQSLINQSVKSKIVISTSTPSDFLDTIADKYNLKLYVNPVRGGIASDWTFAYTVCKTKYVTLAHQDDIYEYRYTEKSIQAMAKDGLISFSDYYELYNGKQRRQTLNLIIKRVILFPFFFRQQVLTGKRLKRLMLSFGSPICRPGVLYNKEMIGDLVFNPDLTINMDWDTWLDLAERDGAFSFVAEKLMGHRIHTDSATTDGLAENRRQLEDIQMFQRVWPDSLVKMLARLYAFSYLSND